MIFASDLDRTLIYSDKFLQSADCKYRLVEIWEEKPISYMSLEAIELLKRLHQVADIVPITTRNYQQYKRIEVFSEILQPELFVVNNGGSIFYREKEDEAWNLHIRRQIESLSLTYDEAMSYFLSCYKGVIKSYRKSDELIWLIIGERDHIDQEGIQAFWQYAKDKGWRIDVNGKKIYLYPNCVNKWAAIAYIKEKYYNKAVIGAGDSLFDYELVHQADYGIVPKGAYIQESCGPHITFTRQEGLRAAEDILSYALSCVMQEKNAME